MSYFFDLRQEGDDIDAALSSYQREMGTEIEWWSFQRESAANAHPVYGESYAGGSARWGPAERIPVLWAQVFEGPEENADGFYTSDRLRVAMSAEMARRFGLVDLELDRAENKDRIVYKRTVFDVRSIRTLGHLGERDITVIVDAVKVDADELVNNPDFVQYAD